MQFPDAVVPRIVVALQAVVCSVVAVAADLAGAASSAAEAVPTATPTAGQLPADKWGSLLSHAVAELGAVLGLLPLHADWKAQLSGAFAELLQQLLGARRWEHSAMLSGFRAALTSGRRRLPLTGPDAAQVGMVGVGWMKGEVQHAMGKEKAAAGCSCKLAEPNEDWAHCHPPTIPPNSCSCALRSSWA